MRFIKDLSDEEIIALKYGHHHGATARFRNRCQAILLSFSGKSIKELCTIFPANRQTICRWLDQWEQGGIEGLSDKPRSGRPPELDLNNELHVKKVKALLKKEQRDLDVILADLEEDLHITVSKWTLQRFLKVLTMDGDVSAYLLKQNRTQTNTKEENSN